MKSFRKYSDELQQYIEVKEIYKGVYMAKTDDGTIYTNSEINLLKEKKVKTPLQVHLIKSIFKGTIEKLE